MIKMLEPTRGGGVARNPATARYRRVVIVTRRTELEELTARFVTEAQARFYLEHAGQSFEPIEQAHEGYHHVLQQIRAAVPHGIKQHVIPRDYLPQYTFDEADLVVTVGPEGSWSTPPNTSLNNRSSPSIRTRRTSRA